MSHVSVDEAAVEAFATAPGGWEDRALVIQAVRVEALAKRLVHVDTGRLRSSIRSQFGADAAGKAAWVGSDVHYAIYQELEAGGSNDEPGDIFPAEAGKYAGSPRIETGGRAYLRPALYSGT